IEGGRELSEDVRLRYRYLDIRRAEMAAALRLRSEATYLASEVLRARGFVYVETPYLTRSTPEGARDFLVPVRLRPGNWYALPQSGSGKPELRFGSELAALTAYFGQTSFRVFQAPHVGAVVMPVGAGQTRRELDGWQEWARARGARGLAYVLIGQDGVVSESGPVAR